MPLLLGLKFPKIRRHVVVAVDVVVAVVEPLFLPPPRFASFCRFRKAAEKQISKIR